MSTAQLVREPVVLPVDRWAEVQEPVESLEMMMREEMGKIAKMKLDYGV